MLEEASEEEREEEEEDEEENRQVKLIESMLQDPDIQKLPRYFLKISNAYYMQAFRFYAQGHEK
jgi:hypothetical protein